MVLSTSAVLSSSTENIKRFSLNHIHNLPPSPFRLYSAVRRLLSRLVTYPLAAPAQSKSSRPPKLFSMSISELEPEETQRRTLRAGDLEKYESEHFLDDNVSHSSLLVHAAYPLCTINRMLPPKTKTIPTSTQEPKYWKMNHHIPKLGPLWRTQMIPLCLRPLCALGLLVSFGLSSSPASTNFSSSDILLCTSVRFVLHDSYLP
jgi:hypothetical protein